MVRLDGYVQSNAVQLPTEPTEIVSGAPAQPAVGKVFSRCGTSAATMATTSATTMPTAMTTATTLNLRAIAMMMVSNQLNSTRIGAGCTAVVVVNEVDLQAYLRAPATCPNDRDLRSAQSFSSFSLLDESVALHVVLHVVLLIITVSGGLC